MINGMHYPNLPIIVSKEFSVIWHLTEFLRVRRIKAGDAELTVERKAGALREFASYLESSFDDTNWDQVDDDVLQMWGVSMRKRTKAANVQFKVSTVVHMYYWAQRNGYFHEMVGVTDIGNHAVFPITVTADRYDPRTGIAAGNVSTTLVFSDTSGSVSRYPSDNDVDAIKDGLIAKAEKSNSPGIAEELLERNMLIVETAVGPGLRRGEIAKSLKVSSLPSLEHVRDCIERGVTIPITIVGKGGKVRAPQFHPELLLLLIDHCMYTREAILDRFRCRRGYTEPDEIFVSAKTGQALAAQSVSELIADAAASQGAVVSMHDLRRKALTRMVTQQRQFAMADNRGPVDDATILLKARQQAGHNDLETSFRSYLQLSKELDEAETAQPYMESEAVRLLNTKIDLLKRKNVFSNTSEEE